MPSPFKEHSPGPWRVVQENGDWQIKTAVNETIMCNMTYYPWVPTNELDWQLMGASPQMLLALRSALKVLHPDTDEHATVEAAILAATIPEL